MSGGLKSCGLKSGGLMSGGLKSYDRVLDGNNFRGRLFQALMLLGRNENLYASVLARRLVYDSVCRIRKARAGLRPGAGRDFYFLVTLGVSLI